MIWPGPHTSPGWMTLRLRISQPLMPDLLGEPVEHALHGELRLVGAEAAERAAHRVVGAHGDVSRRRWSGTRYGPLAWPAARSSTFMPDARVGTGVADRRAPSAR